MNNQGRRVMLTITWWNSLEQLKHLVETNPTLAIHALQYFSVPREFDMTTFYYNKDDLLITHELWEVQNIRFCFNHTLFTSKYVAYMLYTPVSL